MSTIGTAASGRGARWLLFGALALLVPAWLLATESGLAAVLWGAEKFSGGRLTFGAGAGRLSETFSVRDIVYSTSKVTVRIDQASLNLRLTRLLVGRLQAEALDVQALDIATTGTGADDTDGQPLTVSTGLRLAVEQGELRDFRFKRGAAAMWHLPEAQFAGRWRGQWITVAGLKAVTAEAGPVELRGRLAIVDDRLLFEDFSARSIHASLRVEGALGIGAGSSDLKLLWENLRPPGADWLSSEQGEARLTGPWQSYQWTLEGKLTAAAGVSQKALTSPALAPGAAADVFQKELSSSALAPGAAETAAQLSARGRGNLDGLVLERSLLKFLGGSAQGEGRFDWRGGVRTDLTLRWQQLNPGLRYAEWPGVLSGSGRFRGDWRGATPRLEFQASLQDSKLRGYPLALALTGTTQNQQVVLKEFLLQSGVSSLKAQGQLLPKFVLDGSLSSLDLHSLWAGLHGRAQLQAHLRGTRAAPVLQLTGTAGDLVFRNYRAGRAALNAQLALAGRSDLRLELAEVDALVPLHSVSLAVSGTREKHSARFDARGETAAAGFALSGSAVGRRWRGQLTEARFAPGLGPEWLLEEPTPLSFADGRLSVDPVCLAGGESRACVQTQASAGRQHVAFRTRQFELKHLQGLLPNEWTVAGTLNGAASLTVVRGELHDLRADLAGSKGSVTGAGVRLDYGPGELHVQPEGQSLRARLRLTPAGGQVSGDLLLSPAATLLDRRIQGGIKLDLPDLAWLPVLSPEIAAAEGALTGDLRASGTLRSPSLDGRVQLAGGRVQLSTPGIEFTNIGAKFESSARAPLTVSVTANAGEGRLKLDGELLALRPKLAGKFALTGDNAKLFNTPEIRAWVTPDLQLALREGSARLTGELKVTGALITPREVGGLGGGGIAPSGDQVLVSETGEPPGGLNIESEVRIVLGEAVRFDGLGLKTRLTGAITAFDDPGRPTRARGELQLVGGRYKAYGQDLQIERGRLLFNGGPVTDPAIDLSAYREPREDIKVGLRARGTLDAPQFSLYSTPAMSQEEQLSWLVLGRSLSESLKAGAGAELGGAAMSLGLTGSEYLAQQVGTRLGFDQVSVGAKPGETADKARVTIGKYLSPKLFVSYGVGLFLPGNYFRLQYDLGSGFKLSGESGVTSGGDLLYTIER